MSKARERWLDEGVQVLAEDGAGGVRIDRIASRLGRSKGSFHHHFDGADDYRKQLLGHVRRSQVDAFRSAIAETEPDAHPRDVLAHLTAQVNGEGSFYHPALEVALRAWATWDDDAAAVQAEIDEARLAALRDVWRPISSDDETARLAALLPYLIAVGATVLVPPVSSDDLAEIFARVLTLAPDRGER